MENTTQPDFEPSRKDPTVVETASVLIARALRDHGVVDGTGDEAKAVAGYLAEAGLLIADPPVETAVAIELKRTCMAMPEQYEAFRDGRQIGYLRLRHGFFRASYPDHTASVDVYGTGVRGDGSFYDDEEREHELRAAVVELLKADGVENPSPEFEIEPYILEEWDEDSLGRLEEIVSRVTAKRAAIREQFFDDFQSLLDEAVLAGASAREIATLLKDSGFIVDGPPVSYVSSALDGTPEDQD